MPNVSMSIDLISEEGSYSPGDAVKGVVNINVSEQMILSSVKVSLHGIGVLKCLSKDCEDVCIERKETYIEEEKYLFTSKETNIQNLYTEEGNHVFSFTFKLPKNIPSSFESEEGFTRYFISSTLEGPKIRCCNAKLLISVNNVLDLNEISKSQFPATAVVDKANTLWCCAQAYLHAVVHTSRRGYVPGEVITLNAEINNMDAKPIGSVKAQLVQVLKYHHKKWPKKIKRTVTEVTRGIILPHESQYWIDETLLIPAIVASYLQHCNLIDVKYKIYFCISKAGMPEITLKLPIIIGTMPLMGGIDILSTETDQHSVMALDKACASLEACYFGPHNVTEVDSKRNSQEQCFFSPKYITYCS